MFTLNFLELLYHVIFKVFLHCFRDLQYIAMNLRITTEHLGERARDD